MTRGLLGEDRGKTFVNYVEPNGDLAHRSHEEEAALPVSTQRFDILSY